MGFYDQYLLPRLMRVLEPQAFKELRKRVVPQARGIVLEIGVGNGANFKYYDASNVDKIIALEPSPGMISLARRESCASQLHVEYLQVPAEDLDLRDESVDTVLSTATLCTIPNVETALVQMRRVLRPGGELVFLEHGEAPDEKVRKWQCRLGRIHKRIFTGCHVDRRIPQLISSACFKVRELEQFYAMSPKYMSYIFLGTATA